MRNRIMQEDSIKPHQWVDASKEKAGARECPDKEQNANNYLFENNLPANNSSSERGKGYGQTPLKKRKPGE